MTLTSDLQLGVNLYKLYSEKPALDISGCISFLIKDDLELQEAFRILSSELIFLNYFDSDNYLVNKKKLEVDELIDAKLLLVPSLRIKRILKGYCSADDSLYEFNAQQTITSEDIVNKNSGINLEKNYTDNRPSMTPNDKSPFREKSSSNPLSSAPTVSNSSLEQSISSGNFDSSTISDPSLVEHATLFAAPGSSETALPTQSSFSNSQPESEASNRSKFLIKTILILLAIISLSISLFKVEALCEPLGLCDADNKSEEDSKKESNDDQGSKVIDPKANESTGRLDSATQNQSVDDSPLRIPPSQQSDGGNYSEPDREEALW